MSNFNHLERQGLAVVDLLQHSDNARRMRHLCVWKGGGRRLFWAEDTTDPLSLAEPFEGFIYDDPNHTNLDELNPATLARFVRRVQAFPAKTLAKRDMLRTVKLLIH